MSLLELIREIKATYARHGWRLERVLLSPGAVAEVGGMGAEVFEGAVVKEAGVDALWFARPSHASREAWELRLLAEQPYALFETFEPDETEEEREEARLEMEARMREYAARP